jgi:putative Mg2+ transporter-C (MgtC) family protein
MPLTLDWREILLRLSMAALAGGIIGINRGEQGRPAGLRTTLLICLAATLAMIEANLLLSTTGKNSLSFVQIDPMRLPLGILSGIGFIGGGAILRRGDRVLGVTTAATMWFVTVMGLCFGGGHIALGLAAFVIGLTILWLLKHVENGLRQERQAIFTIVTTTDGPSEADIRTAIRANNCKIGDWAVAYSNQGRRRRVQCQVSWRARISEVHTPTFVNEFAGKPGVIRLRWKP